MKQAPNQSGKAVNRILAGVLILALSNIAAVTLKNQTSSAIPIVRTPLVETTEITPSLTPTVAPTLTASPMITPTSVMSQEGLRLAQDWVGISSGVTADWRAIKYSSAGITILTTYYSGPIAENASILRNFVGTATYTVKSSEAGANGWITFQLAGFKTAGSATAGYMRSKFYVDIMSLSGQAVTCDNLHISNATCFQDSPSHVHGTADSGLVLTSFNFTNFARVAVKGLTAGQVLTVTFGYPGTATATPTLIPTYTSTPTLTPTNTPTITPTPNRGGSGTCWNSGASWPDYTATYSIDSSIPSDWVDYIESAALRWTSVSPSHFAFSRSQESPNFIDKGHVDDPGWIAITYIYATPTTPITLVTTTFDENDSFDPGFPPASDSYSVENVMVHEFGHWLYLLDQYDSNCSEVTMYGIGYHGQTNQITFDDPDKEAINWQYP